MNKLWAWSFLVLLGLALMSRHVDGAARADVPEFGLNEAFTLSGGQEVRARDCGFGSPRSWRTRAAQRK